MRKQRSPHAVEWLVACCAWALRSISDAAISRPFWQPLPAGIPGSRRVLPDYRCPAIELYAVFAPGKPVPPRIRLFVDHLIQAFRRLQGSDTKADGIDDRSYNK